MLTEIRNESKYSYMSFGGLKGKVFIKFNGNSMSENILEAVCKFYGQDIKSVIGKRRQRSLCMCRHVSAMLIRKYTNMGLKEIGDKLGGRDHTTILNSVRVVEGWMKTDEDLVMEIKTIQDMI